MDAPPEYAPKILPPEPDTADLQAAAATYRAICLTSIAAIVSRFEAHIAQGRDYPFVDTKLDLASGRDFPADNAVRGRDTIYGWIQGRGLEALAGHAAWLAEQPSPRSLGRSPAEHGPNGHAIPAAFAPGQRRPSLFLYAARWPALCPGWGRGAPLSVPDRRVAEQFQRSLRRQGPAGRRPPVDRRGGPQPGRNLRRAGRRRSVGRPLPDRPASPRPGQSSRAGARPHRPGPLHDPPGQLAPWARLPATPKPSTRVCACSTACSASTPTSTAIGPNWPTAISGNPSTGTRRPYRTPEGRVLCDPGHALEFVGLGLKFARATRACTNATPAQLARLEALTAPLPTVLARNFANGFQAGPGGICKSFDLVGRHPVNTDMPCGACPRPCAPAACAGMPIRIRPSSVSAYPYGRPATTPSSSISSRPDVHLMAIQTRSADGTVSPAIPATADADPGYHTGLSLLDIIDILNTHY